MSPVLWLALLGACVALAALVGRRWMHRRRIVHRLALAETEVAAAVADGRLERPTGEALLQHLEGLRRQCAGVRED